MQIVLTLTGTKSMLQHNGRLANPLDPHTRKLSSLTGKRKKTDDDLYAIMQVEARGGCWETEDGLLGVPNAAVWRSIYDAAKAFKLGEDIKRSLNFEDTTVPIEIDGGKVTCDEYLEDSSHIDYRPVKVGTRKTMRARPLVKAGWTSTHSMDLVESVMRVDDLGPVLERAGRLVGIGDWRPTYGTYTMEVS